MADSSTSFNSNRQANYSRASTASLTSPQLPVANSSTTEKSFTMDPATEDISNFLTRLKFKKNFKDEHTNASEAALVLMSPQVSRVMASLVGLDKRGLRAETRELIAKLEKFFKEYLEAVSVSNGSKALELVQEMVCNPDFVVFQQLLCNQPANWIELGLPIIRDNERKKVIAEQVEKDTKDIMHSRRELAKNIRQRRKELEAAREEHAKKKEKMSLDRKLKLEIALETYKSEREQLEAASKPGSSVTEKKVSELLSKFEKLNVRHKEAQEKLAELSCHSELPPDIGDAIKVLMERKEYLEELMTEISVYTEELDLSCSFDTTAKSLDSMF